MLEEIISLMLVATAAGMDAFSVSLILGMQKVRLRRIATTGIYIGIFHMVMPFIGILLGNVISGKIGNMATLASGLLLVGIGAHMLFSAFNHESKQIFKTTGLGLLIFAFSVSVDSFSVGLSFGISGVRTFFILIIFGLVSTKLTWIGMLIGRKVNRLIGAYSEIFGGSVLCGFGLHIIFT
ncbi:manganese efflux pump MntP family protein [Virgibacillus soli]|uniref:manganese efflux pump MntP n=1 Tax=Paracerasibacillus soli TaxID=480284 RepID=UPI0035E4D8A6